jgi:serine/threonine protein kinase
MKVLKKDKIIGRNLTRYALTERNVLSVSNHPFIVSLQYAFQTEDRLFLVMEYCPGGDLSDYLETEEYFSEDRARLYICEIILAIEDLHSRGIIFRDLKPDNIVLDRFGHCKLTDFGLSKEGLIENEKIAQSFCGSYAYLAPEMVRKTGHGKNVDWYLLGVLLYEMLEGIPPFYDHDKETLFQNILNNPVELSLELSEEAQDLILRLLYKDPNKRLGNKNGAKDIKKHPWFNKINWKDIEKKKYCPTFPVSLPSH